MNEKEFFIFLGNQFKDRIRVRFDKDKGEILYKMTNKEQIQRDIAVAFDFVEQIIDNPELTDKIPEGSVITFIDEENTKTERQTSKFPQKKYVKVKRHFEVL